MCNLSLDRYVYFLTLHRINTVSFFFSAAGFDAQFHRLCYKTIGSCFSVHYRVMEHLGSLESTQEARVALGYRLGQLLRFFRALQTSRVLHNSIVHAKA